MVPPPGETSLGFTAYKGSIHTVSPLSIVHGARDQQENDAEGVMPGKALPHTFWDSNLLLTEYF